MDIGIEEMLERDLTEAESKEIIAIAVSKIAHPLSLASLDAGSQERRCPLQ